MLPGLDAFRSRDFIKPMNVTPIQALNTRIGESFGLDNLLFMASIPVEKHVIKKNSRTIFSNRATGRMFPGKSIGLRSAEQYLTSKLKDFAQGFGIHEPISQPVWVIFHFYFEKSLYFTKKGQRNKNLPDLSNLYELPQDCLEMAGILENDNLIDSHDWSRRIPAENSRLDIFILKAPEASPL